MSASSEIAKISSKDELIQFISTYITINGQRPFHRATQNSKRLRDLIDMFSGQDTDDLAHSEKSELLINRIERPKCVVCGGLTKFEGNSRKFLATCSYKCMGLNPQSMERHKETNMKLYGHENFWGSKKHQEKLRENAQSKYGAHHYMASQDFKDKVKKTSLEKYGVDRPQKSTEVRKKLSDTRKSLDCSAIHEKSRQTWLKKYGVDHPSKVVEIFDRQQRRSYYYKDYKLPSGKIARIQGYENKALDILLTQYAEDDLVISNKEIMKRVGIIWYKQDGVEHRYYPDVLIISTNTIVEVKSTRTFAVQRTKNMLKRQAILDMGLNFEFWIFDEKGLVETL